MRVIGKTRSMCPVCMRFLDANVVDVDGDAHIIRKCPEHGKIDTLHSFDKTKHYLFVKNLFSSRPKIKPVSFFLDITHRCNMNCEFCFDKTPGIEDEEEPTLEEIKSIVSGFGGSFVHLSGGEPTLRNDLPQIIEMINEMGYRVILMTNGLKLDEDYIRMLKEHGLHRVQLQFDYVEKEKTKVVERLEEQKIPLSLFTRVMGGKNVDKLADIVRFAIGNRAVKTLYLIPVWRVGRYDSTEQVRRSKVIEILNELGITWRDMTLSNRFVFHSTEIIKIVLGVDNAGINWCKNLCPIVRYDDKFWPISRLLDLELVNKRLEKIHNLLDQGAPSSYVKAFFQIPFLYFIKKFLTDKRFARFLVGILSESIRSKGEALFITNRGFDVMNLIVGVFIDKYNLDVQQLRACNMYEKDPEGTSISFCLREVLYGS